MHCNIFDSICQYIYLLQALGLQLKNFFIIDYSGKMSIIISRGDTLKPEVMSSDCFFFFKVQPTVLHFLQKIFFSWIDMLRQGKEATAKLNNQNVSGNFVD